MDILMALPERDFDPTESSVPWRFLSDAGHRILFATPGGVVPAADERMVSGKGLGPWSPLLRARKDAREHYVAMSEAPEFRKPLSYEEAAAADYAGLILPGGHAAGMRPYLESEILQRLVADHMTADRPIGAICHGVIVVARATKDGESILRGRRSTALPASMELSAWAMTCLWLGNYYRTYSETVQAEVTAALGGADNFDAGPKSLFRDSPERIDRGFTVRDGNYLSARWPGDAYRFAQDFQQILDDYSGVTPIVEAEHR